MTPSINKINLTGGEFVRLMEQIISPDVFAAANKTLMKGFTMTGKVTDSVLLLELSDLEASAIIAALQFSGHTVIGKLASRYSDRNTEILSLASNIIKKIHAADHDERIVYVPICARS